MKLRVKMFLASMVPMVVSLAALTCWNALSLRRALGDGQAEKARSVAALLVGVVGPNILFKDASAAREGLKQFETDGEFRYAIAVDDARANIASVGNAEGIAAFGKLEALPGEALVEVRGGDRVAMAPVRSGSNVVGAVIIGLSQDKVTAASRAAALAGGGLALLACLAATLISFAVGRAMLRPVGETVRVLEALAEGDVTVRLAVTSTDEMGQMGNAVNHALERVGSTLQGIHAALSRLGSASSKLSALSAQLGENASNTSAKASSAASAAETVSANTNTVAAATEEMGSSVKEIARNAGEAAQVARGAVQTAEATHVSMGKLDEASREIGNVVKLINAIAEQTNLLALNATIEAARAGEAGKGFAVVATEVKELAKQTAHATEDIGRRVSGIQGHAREAVEAIKQIRTVIGQVNDFQTAIATAVEEQAATTREIGRNVAGAAEASAAIAGSISSLAESAQSTNAASDESRESAQELARVASDLQQLVSRFRFSTVAPAAALPAPGRPAAPPPPVALQDGAGPHPQYA